jgi:hypothetical protein
MRSLTTLVLGALAVAVLAHAPSARGQGAASSPAPTKRAPLAIPADVEPAVDVSGPRVALIDAPPPAQAAPPPAASSAAPVAAAAQSAPSAPHAAPQKAAAPAATGAAPAAPAPNSRVLDTLDLGTTSITGNQELPKVLYIVPWRKSDLGDLVGRPVNTLLDEVLEPVDPEVFQRHLSYYDALYGNGQKGKE